MKPTIIVLKVKLVIAGGCRNEGDWERVNFLKRYAMGNFGLESGTDELCPDKQLIWRLNIPFEALTKLMQVDQFGSNRCIQDQGAIILFGG